MLVLLSCTAGACRQQIAWMQAIPGALEQICTGRRLQEVADGMRCAEAAAAAMAADGAQEPAGPQGAGVLCMVPGQAGAA